jgi:hypothetical protein
MLTIPDQFLGNGSVRKNRRNVESGVFYNLRAEVMYGERSFKDFVIFITDKPNFSSERMLHKDYYSKSSVGKKNLWSCVSRDLKPRRTDWLSQGT